MSSFSKFASVEPKYDSLEETRLMENDAESESNLTMLIVLLGASWAFKWSNECHASSFERGFSTELGKPKHFFSRVGCRESFVSNLESAEADDIGE